MPEPHTTNLQTMANYHESCSPGIRAIAETFNPAMAYNALDLSRWSWPLMSSQLRSPCRSFAHFGYSLTRGRIFSMAAHSADTLQASVGMVRLRLPNRFLPCGWGCIASDRTPHLIGWLFEGVQQDLHLQCFNCRLPRERRYGSCLFLPGRHPCHTVRARSELRSILLLHQTASSSLRLSLFRHALLVITPLST